MTLDIGDVIDHRYTVLRSLGRGGMARVWLVQHHALNTLHALKVLRVPTNTLGDRLRREGRVQASLDHPNVARVTDLIEVDGSPALLLEFVDGPSLKDLLDQRRLTSDEADLLFRGIVAGVGAAHAMGLVHRDLKPANVMLQVVPGGVVPKVTDFGLAKVFGDPAGGSLATRSGAVLGTPAYMAPEQIRDPRRVDHRADLFSLCAIAYELLCGDRAFVGDDPAEVMTRVKEGRYDPLPDHLPASMRDAIAQGLQPDPEDRHPDCEALLDTWCRDNDLRDPTMTFVAHLEGFQGHDEVAPIEISGGWSSGSGSNGSSSESTYADGSRAPTPAPAARSVAPAAPPRPPSFLTTLGAGFLGAALFALLAGTVAWGLGWWSPGGEVGNVSPPAVADVVVLPPLPVPEAPDPPEAEAPPVAAPSPPPAAPDPPVEFPPGIKSARQMNEAEKALYRLGLHMTDIHTLSIEHKNDAEWLRHEVPRIIADFDDRVAKIRATHPGTEADFGSKFQAAMLRHTVVNWYRYVTGSPDLPYDEKKAWELEVRAEFEPTAEAHIREAQAIFDEIGALDSPAAQLSTFPGTARMMSKTIDKVRTDLQRQADRVAANAAKVEAETAARAEAKAARERARAIERGEIVDDGPARDAGATSSDDAVEASSDGAAVDGTPGAGALRDGAAVEGAAVEGAALDAPPGEGALGDDTTGPDEAATTDPSVVSDVDPRSDESTAIHRTP